MRLFLSTLGFVALFSMAAGCVIPYPDGDSETEEVGSAPPAQLDGGQRSYSIKQSRVVVAAAWAGTISSGAPVEYWATKPAYSASAARTFEGASQSCASWKRSVCGSSWSGATYYQAAFTQETLDCGLPPGPCQPPQGAVSFLGAGSYATANVDATTFAWTASSMRCAG